MLDNYKYFQTNHQQFFIFMEDKNRPKVKYSMQHYTNTYKKPKKIKIRWTKKKSSKN